jgi:predicted DNA-binding protein
MMMLTAKFGVARMPIPITIDLSPELADRLSRLAKEHGLETREFIIKLVEDGIADSQPAEDSSLEDIRRRLQEFDGEIQRKRSGRYLQLQSKREQGILTPDEQRELIAVSDEIESVNARRVEYLVRQAVPRGLTAEALLRKLGMAGNGHG